MLLTFDSLDKKLKWDFGYLAGGGKMFKTLKQQKTDKGLPQSIQSVIVSIVSLNAQNPIFRILTRQLLSEEVII